MGLVKVGHTALVEDVESHRTPFDKPLGDHK